MKNITQEYQLQTLLSDIDRLGIGDLEETEQILTKIREQSKVPAKSVAALIYKLQILLDTALLDLSIPMFSQGEEESLIIDYISAWQRQDFDYIHTHTALVIMVLKNSEDYGQECIALLDSVESDIAKLCFM